MNEVKEFVDSLTMDEQLSILEEMVAQGRIAIHVSSENTTYDVEDVYDNSSGEGSRYPVLTVLYL